MPSSSFHSPGWMGPGRNEGAFVAAAPATKPGFVEQPQIDGGVLIFAGVGEFDGDLSDAFGNMKRHFTICLMVGPGQLARQGKVGRCCIGGKDAARKQEKNNAANCETGQDMVHGHKESMNIIMKNAERTA